MTSHPERLLKSGRPEDQLFAAEECLYHGYTCEDWDSAEKSIKTASIYFPDFSVNRSKYSKPEDVRLRENGQPTDGCYGFTVGESRHLNVATPVHDPLETNYSHTEIRLLVDGESALIDLPPKGRKPARSTTAKTKRKVYREYLAQNLKILLPATP